MLDNPGEISVQAGAVVQAPGGDEGRGVSRDPVTEAGWVLVPGVRKPLEGFEQGSDKFWSTGPLPTL